MRRRLYHCQAGLFLLGFSEGLHHESLQLEFFSLTLRREALRTPERSLRRRLYRCQTGLFLLVASDELDEFRFALLEQIMLIHNCTCRKMMIHDSLEAPSTEFSREASELGTLKVLHEDFLSKFGGKDTEGITVRVPIDRPLNILVDEDAHEFLWKGNKRLVNRGEIIHGGSCASQ
jgi:hypothetical protein